MGDYRCRDGFTTIELLVVLLIIVIMSGVAAVSMAPALRGARMRSGCRVVAAALNYARSFAVTDNVTARVVFNRGRTVQVLAVTADSSGSQFAAPLTTVAGKRQSLPDGVRISACAKTTGATQENWVDFEGSGQAEGALIEVTDRDGQKNFIEVDPITGRCAIRSYEDETREDPNDVEQIVHE